MNLNKYRAAARYDIDILKILDDYDPDTLPYCTAEELAVLIESIIKLNIQNYRLHLKVEALERDKKELLIVRKSLHRWHTVHDELMQLRKSKISNLSFAEIMKANEVQDDD